MLVARGAEQQELAAILNSNKAEFLAIYGRRRIGKTFLIREFFKHEKCIFFNVTGVKSGTMLEQISHFVDEISRVFYNGVPLAKSKSWDNTFKLLTEAIASLPKKQKLVLFFDEFPWLATPKSKLLQNLDYYWNQHWSQQANLKLIICGSSASWIIKKIINNKGGLHNRITKQIRLEPFNLRDTKKFLNHRGIRLTNKQVLNVYMVTGGIPYYLSQISKGLSSTQIIEQMAFTKNGILYNEFDNLFASLFDNHELSIEIIRIISQYRYGIGQEELFNTMSKNIKGKLGLKKLSELQEAGFIISFKPHWHKKRGIYYKLIDEYSLFYLRWVEPVKNTLLAKSLPSGYWDAQQNSPAWHSWAGLAFEAICYKHLSEIQQALQLMPTAIPSTWRHVAKQRQQQQQEKKNQVAKESQAEQGAQIDLLFDRTDDAITICEIKCTAKPFNIDKAYAKKLMEKVAVFKKITKTNKQIFIALVASAGLRKTIYSEELVDSVVALDKLFENL